MLTAMRKSLVAELSEQAKGQEPFDRFTDLTRRIVAVPKSEIAEREASERKPKRPKAVAP